MKTTIPYAYTEKFQWNRKSGYREAVKIGHVSADIPSISAHELRPFARWIATEMSTPSGDEQDRVCSSYDGHLYMQVFDWDDRPVSEVAQDAATKWNLEAVYQITSAAGLTGFKQEKFDRAIAAQAWANPTWAKEAVTSDQDAQRATAQELVDGLMFVDGKLWKRCAAPRVKCDAHFGGRYFMFAPDTTHRRERKWGPVGQTWFFGLSELDVLSNHRIQWTNAGFRDLEVYEVEPEPFLGRHELLARTMDLVVEKADVATLSRAAILDWTIIRDAVTEYFVTATGEVAPGSEEALRKFQEMRLPKEISGEIENAFYRLYSLDEAAAQAARARKNDVPSLSFQAG